MHDLPDWALLRLKQIIGDRKADPPIPAIIPVSKSSWWAGVKSGRYPKPKKLGSNTTVWTARDGRAGGILIAQREAAGCEHTTAADETYSACHNNRIPSLLKRFVVTLALRGLLPYRAADWLIRRGGLRHA